MASAPTARVTRGWSPGIDQAIQAPQSCPTTKARCAPRPRTTPATSAASVGVSYPRGGLSEAPYPRRSMATAWYPASASAGSWWRQAHQNCGKPCSSRTSGPAPASATWKRAPFAATNRCRQGPSTRISAASIVTAWRDRA